MALDMHICSYCSYKCRSKTAMSDHLRIHTGEKPFKCTTCKRGFSQKSNLKQHMKTHEKSDLLSCNLCDFKTKWKSSMTLHVRWHSGERPFKCPKCNLCFSQATHRSLHLSEVHNEERRFACYKCKKKFKRQEHLKKHLDCHNSNVAGCVCPICDKKFQTLARLKMHSRRVHENIVPDKFQCYECDFKTRYKQSLSIHQLRHNNSKPIICEICFKHFRTASAQRSHLHTQHGHFEATRIFRCSECEFGATSKACLISHQRKIHFCPENSDMEKLPTVNKRIKCEMSQKLAPMYAEKTELTRNCQAGVKNMGIKLQVKKSEMKHPFCSKQLDEIINLARPVIQSMQPTKPLIIDDAEILQEDCRHSIKAEAVAESGNFNISASSNEDRSSDKSFSSLKDLCLTFSTDISSD